MELLQHSMIQHIGITCILLSRFASVIYFFSSSICIKQIAWNDQVSCLFVSVPLQLKYKRALQKRISYYWRVRLLQQFVTMTTDYSLTHTSMITWRRWRCSGKWTQTAPVYWRQRVRKIQVKTWPGYLHYQCHAQNELNPDKAT